MAYSVRFLPRAEQDLEAIYRKVIQAAPLQGAEWFDRFEEAIYSLSNLPERCIAVPSLSTKVDIVRQMLFGSYPDIYKVYYHVVGNTVEIMHVRHGARRNPGRRGIHS